MRRALLLNQLKLRHQLLRRLEMRREIRNAISRSGTQASKNGQGAARVFNLDLHIGVVADLRDALEEVGTDLTSWSISMHNHLVTGKRPIPDPVRWINASKWRSLNPRAIHKFTGYYGRYLASFDGFLVTYPTTFSQIFEMFERPILCVIATRYETPFTLSEEDWRKLDSYLIAGIEEEKIIAVANNRGDADYFKYYTGVDLEVVPSLNDKCGLRWTGTTKRRVIVGKSRDLVAMVEHTSGFRYSSITSLGTPFNWSDLLRCQEVCVLPQNISTMLLFELATAGVPVAVPGRELMRKLVSQYPTLLGELTFAQLELRPTSGLSATDPCNWSSDSYLDWWLERADFYQPSLMPNVRTFDSFDELCNGHTAAETLGENYLRTVEERNYRVRQQRTRLIARFQQQLVPSVS